MICSGAWEASHHRICKKSVVTLPRGAGLGSVGTETQPEMTDDQMLVRECVWRSKWLDEDQVN